MIEMPHFDVFAVAFAESTNNLNDSHFLRDRQSHRLFVFGPIRTEAETFHHEGQNAAHAFIGLAVDRLTIAIRFENFHEENEKENDEKFSHFDEIFKKFSRKLLKNEIYVKFS